MRDEIKQVVDKLDVKRLCCAASADKLLLDDVKESFEYEQHIKKEVIHRMLDKVAEICKWEVTEQRDPLRKEWRTEVYVLNPERMNTLLDCVFTAGAEFASDALTKMLFKDEAPKR